MPVFSDSRYVTSRQIDVEDKRQAVTVSRALLYTHDPLPVNVQIREIHEVIAGERLDQLAFRFGGDSRLWWVIAEVNNIFGYPLFLEAGTKLKIPVRRVFTDASRNGVL